MNLQELLDQLNPEDQKKVIEHFLATLRGEVNPEPITLRRTFKLSTLSSEEEMKNQVATAMGIPAENLENFDFLGGISTINEHYKKVESLITPYREYLDSLKSKADKYDELNDIGKFLAALSTPYTLVIPEKPIPYPDFIITDGKSKIGLEHTRILNVPSQRIVKNIKQIFQQAEKLIHEKNETLTQIINLGLNYHFNILNSKGISSPHLSKTEKDQIAEILSDFVLSYLKDKEIEKPGFINRIDYSVDSVHALSLNLNESYIGNTDIEAALTKRLNSKEKKHSNYSTNAEELWLVLVVNGVSSASSYLINETQIANISSKFAKVYLFDVFSSELNLLYDTPSI